MLSMEINIVMATLTTSYLIVGKLFNTLFTNYKTNLSLRQANDVTHKLEHAMVLKASSNYFLMYHLVLTIFFFLKEVSMTNPIEMS